MLKPTTRTGFALTAFQQIVNDTFEFGVCNVRLRPSASEPAEVVEYEVRVSINARNDWRRIGNSKATGGSTQQRLKGAPVRFIPGMEHGPAFDTGAVGRRRADHPRGKGVTRSISRLFRRRFSNQKLARLGRPRAPRLYARWCSPATSWPRAQRLTGDALWRAPVHARRSFSLPWWWGGVVTCEKAATPSRAWGGGGSSRDIGPMIEPRAHVATEVAR